MLTSFYSAGVQMTDGPYGRMTRATRQLLSALRAAIFTTFAVVGLGLATGSVAQTITTIAGTGAATYSGDGGQATSAGLNSPFTVALDGIGNLYVADSANNRVRRLSLGSGVITLVAGNGTAAFAGDGASAPTASLNYPEGLAFDSAGDLYISDTTNHRIRKVTLSTGIITTVAGNGAPAFGGDNGLATSASISNPRAIAFDASNNLYIVDQGNNRIRRVAALTGVITTIAGTGANGFSGDGGQATSAQLWSPVGIAVDASGNYFIADQGNNRIRKVTASTGVITTVAGAGGASFSGDGGAATSAELNAPTGVALDAAGNLFISDYLNNRIRELTVGTGIIATVVGNGTPGYGGDNGLAALASIDQATNAAIDSAGNIYVADYVNNRIRKIAPSPVFSVSGTTTFPNIGLNGRSAFQTVTVTNTGTANLVISGITLDNPANFGDSYYDDFRPSANPGYTWCGLGSDALGAPLAGSRTLTPGNSCTFNLYFKPGATVGAKTATLTFATNATPATQTITLTGTGITGNAPTVPGTPTATAYNGYATVSFGGSASPDAVVGYTVVSNPPGGFDSNGGSGNTAHIVTGLNNGTAYTFTVVANNGIGSAISPSSTAVTPTTPALALPKPVSQANLLAYYPFTSTANNAMGGSPYNLGAATLTGGSISLGGTADYANNTPVIDGVGYKSFSFSVDFNMDATFNGGPVLMLGPGWRTIELGVDSSLHPRLSWHNGGYSYTAGPGTGEAVFTGTTLTKGTWYRATVVVDIYSASPTFSLYIGGALVGTVPSPATLPANFLFDVFYNNYNASDRVFSFVNPGNGSAFKGLANNLLIYGSALSSGQVASLNTALGIMGGLSPLTITPTSLNFSGVSTGTASAKQTVLVHNPNAVAVAISASVTGTDFRSYTPSCGASIPAGGDCMIDVDFAPSATSEFPSQLNITTSAGLLNVGLAGLSQAYSMGNSGSLSFGTAAVGSQTSTQTVTFSNGSSGAAKVESVSLVGANAADFAITSENCTTTLLAGAGSCQVTVRFAPLSAGASKTAAISLNHANTSYQNASLSGNAVVPTGPLAFLTNSQVATVSVFDTGSNTIVATVPVGTTPWGVAVSPSGAEAYIGNYADNTVSVINAATYSVTNTIGVGTHPYGIAINPAGTRVYVANRDSNNVTVLNASTKAVVTTVSVGNAPYGVALNPAGTKLYVTNQTDNSLSVVDTSTNTVVATVLVGATPAGVTVSNDGNSVYVANYSGNSVSVINAANNTVATTISPIAGPYAIAMGTGGNRAYVSNYNATSGTVTVIDTTSNTVLTTVPVGSGAYGVALTPDGSKLYVDNSESLSLSVINTSNNTVATTVSIGTNGASFGQFIVPAAVVATAPSITSVAPPNGTVSVSYFYTGTASGSAPITWSILSGSLPPGLTLNGATGQLSGTPTAAGSYTFTVQAANGTLPNATAIATIVISSGLSAAPPTVNFGSVPSASSSTVQTVTITKASGVFCLDFNAPTFSGADAASFAIVTNTCTGTNTSPACSIGVQFNASGANGARSAAVTISGAYGAGCSSLVAPPPDGAPKAQHVQPKGAPTPSVSIALSGTVGTGGTAPVITSGAPPSGLVGNSYSFTPSASGTGPITWSIAAGSLPPGLSLNSSTGNISGSLTTAGTFTFTLRATNSAGQANQATGISVTVPIIPAISVSPAALNFGNQNIGVPSAAQTVTVSNVGNGPFDIRSITGIGDFSFAGNCPATLVPNATCTITVSFTPLTAGALSGLISVNTSAQRGDGSISLSGTGIAVPRPNIIINPSGLSFGDQAVGSSATPQAVFISNTGQATLELRSQTLTGGGFNQAAPLPADNPRNLPGCGSTLAAGTSCILGFAFTPVTTGPATGSYTITHNATPSGVTGTSTISLTGNGTPRREPRISLSGGASFGELVVGTTSPPQQITVTNSGTANLSVGGVSVTANNSQTSPGEFSASSSCATLLPNASCGISVTFNPSGALGLKSATLTISSNAVNASAATASLFGTALPVPVPVVKLSATSLGFGTVIFGGGATASHSVVITNAGVRTLILGGIVAANDDYTQVNNCTRPLEPNQTCTVTVTFGPTGLGGRAGTLTISSNALSSPDKVTLSGNGCALLPPAARRFFIGTSCSN